MLDGVSLLGNCLLGDGVDKEGGDDFMVGDVVVIFATMLTNDVSDDGDCVDVVEGVVFIAFCEG